MKKIIDCIKLTVGIQYKNSNQRSFASKGVHDEDPIHLYVNKRSMEEMSKKPKRFDVINFCLKYLNRKTTYLEIGVRYPQDNFDKVKSETKYSVDPGIENKMNPADFKLTSDVFFSKLKTGELLPENVKFDIIFIDGLHLADQVERDIKNSLHFIKDDGFIIVHDCNPPTEFHARENYSYFLSPAKDYWTGTTWKAFFKFRQNIHGLSSCCIDTDWGVGVINKKLVLKESSAVDNPFFEFRVFEENRENSLGLVSFLEFQKMLDKPSYL